jgi:predicted nuclease of predicted toxin-antitoxin system
MIIWVDAQLPPTLATWLTANFMVEAVALRDIGLRDSRDIEIFEAARNVHAVIMTKDSDFVDLVCRLGIPPQILWLTCGNVTNRNLHNLLLQTLPLAIERLQENEWIIEITNAGTLK